MVQVKADAPSGASPITALQVCAVESIDVLPRVVDGHPVGDAIARRSSVQAVAVAPAGGVLDLHEGLCPLGPTEGCSRWPKNAWLCSDLGQMVRGRCKATNLCSYCARLAAVENTEMLALDAMAGDAPQVWMVLTTSTATTDMSVFYVARRKLMEALRDRFGRQVEYSSLLEFTTGYGPRSGGRRRPHWNVLLKGVTPDDLEETSRIVNRVWCPRVKAKPQAQYVEEITNAAALMQYVAMHFQKESQSPPRGFRGQRFNCSRGYFGDRTRAEMREEAHRSLRSKRELWKARQYGYSGQEAEDLVAEVIADAERTVWAIYFEPDQDDGPLTLVTTTAGGTNATQDPHEDHPAPLAPLVASDDPQALPGRADSRDPRQARPGPPTPAPLTGQRTEPAPERAPALGGRPHARRSRRRPDAPLASAAPRAGPRR